MFKQTILAIAASSLLLTSVALAEGPTVYGSIRYEAQQNTLPTTMIGYQSPDGKILGYNYYGTSISNLADSGSRIGVKGRESLGNETDVIYNLEWDFNGMEEGDPSEQGFQIRYAYLGIKNNQWGTLFAGRQENPFKYLLVNNSVAYDFNGNLVIDSAAQRAMTTLLNGTGLNALTATSDNTPINFEDPQAYYTNVTPTITDTGYSRIGKTVSYTTPDFAGFSATGAVMMDASEYGNVNSSSSVDLWTITGQYNYDLGNNDILQAQIGFIQGKIAGNGNGNLAWQHKNNSNMWGIFLGYLGEAVTVTGSYADGDYTPTLYNETYNIYSDGNKINSKGWDLGAQYSFGANYFTTLRIAYGESQVKQANQTDEVQSWAIGFQQNFNARTFMWLEYGIQDTKFNDVRIASQRNKALSLGLRHDF